MDAATAQILHRWLEPPDRYRNEPEYPGEPRIHPRTQWVLLARYLEEADRRTFDPGAEQDDPVEPLEALALARLITVSMNVSIPDMVKDARAAGASWADIGKALGMARQSAWEKYAEGAESAEAATP